MQPTDLFVEASAGAFAAILADGSVVTWGHPVYGADSRGVRDQLIDVKETLRIVDEWFC